MLRALAAASAAAVLGLAAPGWAAGGTTVRVSATQAAPDDALRVDGMSDCQLMHVALEYRDHTGAHRFGGTDVDGRLEPASGRYVYGTTIRVPRDARPGGDVVVQAEQACGSAADGFPPSQEVRVLVVPAAAHLAVSPDAVRPGARLTVTGRCFGASAAAVPVTVRWPGGERTAPAGVSGGVLAVTFRLPPDAAPGDGSVVLAQGCPGTALPATAGFRVRALAAEPEPSGSPSALPAPPGTPDRGDGRPDPDLGTPAAVVLSKPVSRGPGAWPAYLAAALLAAGLGVAAVARRRVSKPGRKAAPVGETSP